VHTHTGSGLFCSRQHVKSRRKKILCFQESRRSFNLRLHRHGVNTDMANFHGYSFISMGMPFFCLYHFFMMLTVFVVYH